MDLSNFEARAIFLTGITYMYIYQFCRHVNIFHNGALLKISTVENLRRQTGKLILCAVPVIKATEKETKKTLVFELS